MTDAFERPDTRVLQSARPRFATTQIQVHGSDNGGSRLKGSGSARASMRSRHMAEITAAGATVSAQFAGLRSSITDAIDAEFAYKISAAQMLSPAHAVSAIITALNMEKAAKKRVAQQALGMEQKSMRLKTLAPLRARHKQEHSAQNQTRAPSRPKPRKRSSYAFTPLRNY